VSDDLPKITVTKAMRVMAARYLAALQFGAPPSTLPYYERALAKAVVDRIARVAPNGPDEAAAVDRVRAAIERARARDAEWQRRFRPSLSTKEIAELERLALFDGESEECARCRATTRADDGLDPTAVCHACAQEIVSGILPSLLSEVRAARAASEGGDDVAGALRDLLLSADCAWESIGGGHDWREACDRARSALALYRSGGGAAVRAARSLVSREDFWCAVRATGTVLPGEYDDLVDALRTAGSGGGDAREAGRKEGLEQAARALRHDPSVLASMNLEQIRDEVRSLPERVLALRAPSPDTGERGSTGNEGRE
jgi:hypothetical protein